VGISSSRSSHPALGFGLAVALHLTLVEPAAATEHDAATLPTKRGCTRGSVNRSLRGYSKRLDRDEVARRQETGQATVEFALVLVALVSVVWALLSLCLIVRDQVLVTHASREAARTYAVTRSADAATSAARDRSGLGSELIVTVEPQADNLARVNVTLSIASRIPIVGRFRPELQLQSSLITYIEPG
jgi:TadE-like protein